LVKTVSKNSTNLPKTSCLLTSMIKQLQYSPLLLGLTWTDQVQLIFKTLIRLTVLRYYFISRNIW
jgi:hypothetical protein